MDLEVNSKECLGQLLASLHKEKLTVPSRCLQSILELYSSCDCETQEDGFPMSDLADLVILLESRDFIVLSKLKLLRYILSIVKIFNYKLPFHIR